MSKEKKEWVQCFYNVIYNHLSYDGQSKYAYGVAWLKLLGDDCDILSSQIMKSAELNADEVFNFNITTLTPFHENVFEDNPNELQKN